jgi:transposase
MITYTTLTRPYGGLSSLTIAPIAMPFRHISRDFKVHAMELYEQGHLPDDICNILGVSRDSFSRWRENLEVHGDVIPAHNPTQGRPCTLDAYQIESLVELVQQALELYLDEIQEWLAVTHDVGLSRSAIDQLLRDAGLTYKMLQKAAIERDEFHRDEFRNWVSANLVASMIVTADESSKDDHTIFRWWGRSARGDRAIVESNFVCGERYSIVAAISIDGYEAVRVVDGSVDSAEFFDFIVEDVVSNNYVYHANK